MQVSLKETTVLQRLRREGQSLISPKVLGTSGEILKGWVVEGLEGMRHGDFPGIRLLSANEFIITAQEN